MAPPQTAETGPDTIVATLKAWVIEKALPLWSTAGWDAMRGGFVERLGTDGLPELERSRRVRVQARQIYCFAKAAQMGWRPDAKAIALKGLDYLLAKARAADGRPGYAHLLSADGVVIDSRRDAYDFAFVLLALASTFAITRDAQIRAEIDRALNALDEMRSPHGGFNEGVPPTLPRRQNPQMHLFEAMLALYEATGELEFQTRAGDFFGLFVANLFDPRTRMLGEYFEEDWSRINPVIVEPGHHAEWVWLLRGFERNTRCPTGKFRAALLQSALRFRDEGTGCLIDEVDGDGQVRKASRRLWPQTEIAKAFMAQAETGEAGAKEEARQALLRIDRHYLDHPVDGCWYEQFDQHGRSVVDFVPASSLYHIVCAIAEADRVLS